MRAGSSVHANGTTSNNNSSANPFVNLWRRLPSLSECAVFLRWLVVSYSILCLSIIAYTLLDALIKLVMESCGLIPLDMLYVLQTGASTYGLLVLFIRSFAFWAAVQGFNYVHRLIYPSSASTTTTPDFLPENAKLFQ